VSRAVVRRAVAALACASVVAGPALAQVLSSAAAPGECTGVRARSGGWQHVVAPVAFDEVGITAYAVTPDQTALYVTDGHLVARSTNGGCSWAVVLDRDTLVRDELVHLDVDRVVDVEVPRSPGAAGTVYVAVEADVAGLRRADVLVSSDGGATWTAAGLGLPVLGAAPALSVGSPDAAALVIDTAPVPGLPGPAPLTGRGVYATTDGGATWTRRSPSTQSAPVSAVVVDPADPAHLLGHSAGGVLTSADGGASFAPTAVRGEVTGVAVATTARGTRVAAVTARDPVLHRSADGGRSWRSTPLPGPAHSVAALDGPDLTAVVVDGSLLVVTGADLVDVTPPTRGPASDVRMGGGRLGPTVLARAEGGLVRRSFAAAAGLRAALDALPRLDLHAAPPSVVGTPTLTPAYTDLLLAAGASRLVPYTLDLPPAPTPVDVFFLIDTTASMGPTIEGLRRGLAEIVNELADARIEAQFGVAEFKDYPESPWGGPFDTPYHLLRGIGPADASLEKAIESLQAGGGGDFPEAALPALYQTVTGEGQDGVATYIQPGRGAGFRPGALRVVITATDVAFHREAGYPGPSFAETVAALRRRDVRQVGLAVHGGGRRDLTEMAAATRAFAPATGLDCDGDGRLDLVPGAPLVCDVGDTADIVVSNGVLDRMQPQLRIAPAVVALVRSVRDEAAVELQALRPDISRVVGPARIESVDGKRAQRLHFVVQYTCPADGETNNATAPLRAIRRDAVLAEASGFLRCIPPPVPVEELLPPHALPPLAAIVLVPPLLPPPAPVAQGQPNTNPNPNPNPQSQPQGQAGVAAIEQPEREVAVAATRDDRAEPATELAMSARGRPDDTAPAVALALASAAICGCAGAALARSRPAEPVRVRVRSR